MPKLATIHGLRDVITKHTMKKRAFTLIELLTVIAIISILAAILFPVFARAKAAAKKAQCISNLSQIGKGIILYMNDYDDVFPHAIDPSDRYDENMWDSQPDWKAEIPRMPMLHEALDPYVKSVEVFHCPSDTGMEILDNHYPDPFPVHPSMHLIYRCSYLFRTEIAFRAWTSTSFQLPANVNVMFDAAGHWHGGAGAASPNDDFEHFMQKRREYRYNTLFGDFHVKSLTADQLSEAWATEL